MALVRVADCSEIRLTSPDAMSALQRGDFDLQQTLQQSDGWSLELAVHRPTGRLVHLLMFSQVLSQLSQFRAAVRTDRDTLLQLQHACIQKFQGFAESDGELLCWMEAPEAPKLASLIEAGTKLSADEIIDVGWQICSALQQMHNVGLAHGALSADTVMLTEGLQPMITAVGLQRWLNAAATARAQQNQSAARPALISVSAFASAEQVQRDLRDLAALLKHLLEHACKERTQQPSTTSLNSRLARLLDRLLDPAQPLPLTARELQGRLGEILIDDTEMPIHDCRDDATGYKSTIIGGLFENSAAATATPAPHVSAGSAGYLPKLPILITVGILLLLTLLAVLIR